MTRRREPAAARGQAALVTGASPGIREAFARRLSQSGVDLLITTSPEQGEPLERLAGELAARHAIRCETVAVNLAVAAGPDELHPAAHQRGFAPCLLVNNAGIGIGGPFASSPQPYFAVFLLRFREALWAEPRCSGVRVLTLDDVVEGALGGLERDEPVVVLQMPLLGRAYHIRARLDGVLTRRARLRAAERLKRLYFERT